MPVSFSCNAFSLIVLLSKQRLLNNRSTAQDHRKQGTHHNSTSAGSTAIYRQVPSASRTQDNICQYFKVYDLVHEVADSKPTQLFR